MKKFFLPANINRFFLWLEIALLALLALASVWPWLVGPGVPYTHDGENHLLRAYNSAAALREGQWPPRWAGYLDNGFGNPVFIFHNPLPHLLSAPLVWLGLPPKLVLGIPFALAAIASAFGWHRLLIKKSWLTRWSTYLLWFGSSYWLSTSVYRGNIGEALALGLGLLSLSLITEKIWWQVPVWTALLLAHNLFGPVFWVLTIMWGLYAVWQFPQLKRSLLISAIASLLMSLWFWIPALAELGYTVLQSDDLATKAYQHTLTLNQSLFDFLRQGFSVPGLTDELGIGMGWSWLAMIIVLITSQVTAKRKQKSTWLLISGVSVLFSLSISISGFVWMWLPGISIWQFPWRLLALVLFGSLLAWQDAAEIISLKGKIIVFAMALFAAQGIFTAPLDWRNSDPASYLFSPHTSTTRNETRPRTAAVEKPQIEPSKPTIATGSGEISNLEWRGSRHEFAITASEPLIVQEPTWIFPGWETLVNGTKVNYLNDHQFNGTIVYQVEKSSEPQQVVTRFTSKTPARISGLFLSLFGFVLWLIISFKEWREE